jgi:endonuclease/exonuclease/phosphatase family metal-dependent hydrolase
VGVLYDPSAVALVASRALFEDDHYAFPRAPLELDLAVGDVELRMIVLHLKAFAADVDRRRAACAKLDEYLSGDEGARVILLGDLNDDPYDPPADNAFTGTFLDAAPRYHFLTHALPPESVSSVGYHHFVDGVQIEGEFLDHIIVTGAFADLWGTPVPVIHAEPPSAYDAWESDYSDHFPVVLELGAAGE